MNLPCARVNGPFCFPNPSGMLYDVFSYRVLPRIINTLHCPVRSTVYSVVLCVVLCVVRCVVCCVLCCVCCALCVVWLLYRNLTIHCRTLVRILIHPVYQTAVIVGVRFAFRFLPNVDSPCIPQSWIHSVLTKNWG